MSPTGFVSGPAMEVFGQPAAANLTVSSSAVTVASGQPHIAEPAAPHPPSNSHIVSIPHTDARWVISVTVTVLSSINLKSVTKADKNNLFQILTVQRIPGIHYSQSVWNTVSVQWQTWLAVWLPCASSTGTTSVLHPSQRGRWAACHFPWHSHVRHNYIRWHQHLCLPAFIPLYEWCWKPQTISC